MTLQYRDTFRQPEHDGKYSDTFRQTIDDIRM